MTTETTARTELIHETALRVLEKVGVDVEREEVRGKLAAAGAKPGATGKRVLFPRGLVEEALAKCPRTFALATVAGGSLPLGGGRRYFSSCVVDPFIYEHGVGRRPPRLADCLAGSRLTDAVDLISLPYKMDLRYSDAEGDDALYVSNYLFMAAMGKHYTIAPHGLPEARIWREMCEIVSGGPLAERPIASVLVSPLSPLTFDATYLDLLGFCAPAGFPLVLLPCPLSGGTAPVTLAGTAVVFASENLASIALIQTLWPGTRLIFDNVAMALSLATGASSLGGPEKILLGRIGVELGRRYGLPCGIAGSSTDSCRYDVQNGAESMGQIAQALSANPDIVYGLGSMDGGNGTSLEQILFDCELVALADYGREGIAVDEAACAFASIERTGPGGDFLTDPLTLERLRGGEHFPAGSFDRGGSSGGSRGMVETLHEKAAALVSSHRTRVPEATRRDLRRYVEARASMRIPECGELG